jgi:single-stranded-DNA-specific exonuclease
MPKKWNVLNSAPDSFLKKHPELPELAANLLYNRNITTPEQIEEFLHPDYTKHIHDPFLFQHMQRAVDRIFEAMEKDETITVYGDYDADGVSAAVILHSLFKALDYDNFNIFLPHREFDGYGLNTKNVQTLFDEGTKLLISCDCGVSNAPEVDLANELGMDVIITDHHSIPEVIPNAYAIIHPKIPGEPYPDKNLAGGAVAFKLMQGILIEHKKRGNENLPNGEKYEAFEKWQLDMAALASVADMVPLVGESRTLTKYGLIVLNKAKRLGMKKLFLEAKILEDDGTMKRSVDATTIGFRIAPRINAAGRMKHANVAYQLLIAEKGTDAVDLAYELEQNNNDRRELTDRLFKEGIQQVEQNPEAPFLFVLGEGWSTGVVGLIAGKIKEQYQKPTIVMALNNGEITGSGRSIEGFDLIASLQSMPQFFTKFGGHPMACGFTMVNPEAREDFQKELTKTFVDQTKDIDLTPTLDIDAEVQLSQIDWDLYDTLQKFEPFGQTNPEPTYLAKDVTVHSFKSMGKDGAHITIMMKDETGKIRKTIGWGMCDESRGDGKDWCKLLKPGDVIDIVFTIGVNEWNGNRELQLTIQDLRTAQ